MSAPSARRRLGKLGYGRRRGENGSVTLELAVLAPALLLVIFAVVQGALYFYARSVALGSAQEGVRVGRAYQSSVAAGETTAREFLAQAGGGFLQNPAVSSAGSTSVDVCMQMTGEALAVLPGVPKLGVSQSSCGPVERFTTPGNP